MRRAELTSCRPPSYVSRETGAAELDMSPDTWDAMVKAGKLPKPIGMGTSGTTPRWRWADVDAALSGRSETTMVTPEPYFREVDRGATKERRRGTA